MSRRQGWVYDVSFLQTLSSDARSTLKTDETAMVAGKSHTLLTQGKY